MRPVAVTILESPDVRPEEQPTANTKSASEITTASSAITERRYVHLFDKQRTDDVVRQAMAF